jgi:hypothetical protein
MPRKPIEHEVRGLQTPRERIWAAIRALKKGFTTLTVQDACAPMVPLSCVEDYMNELVAAGFVKKVGAGDRVSGRAPCITLGHKCDLVKNQFDAPRLNNGGKAVTQGLGVLAMWRAMKVMQKGFDHNEVAKAASQDGFVVKVATAKTYVHALARAGYFQQLKPAKPGTPARYRLLKNTGPHAPAITRRKCVFDRNTGTFAELETPQEVCDGIE